MIPDVKNILEEIDRAIKPVPGEGFDTWKKPDASYVTSLDIQLQNRIVEIIRDHYPGHTILFEEGDREDRGSSSSGCTWVIDPIDGTNNMVKGKKEYGTAVGVMHNSRFFAALVAFPQIGGGESYIAIRQKGITVNGKPFTAPAVIHSGKNSSGEIVLCSKSYRQLKPAVEKHGYTATCYYCATYSMLRVLKKDALLYHTRNTMLYDVGPMSLVLEMTGNAIYNRQLEPLTYQPSLEPIPFFLTSPDPQLAREFVSIADENMPQL